MLITSKAGTWELLINYLNNRYRNECTAAGRKGEVAAITYSHIVGENSLELNRLCHHYQIVQEFLYQQ